MENDRRYYQELQSLWKKYKEPPFNLDSLPERIIKYGEKITFEPRRVIVNRGEFPANIYFIQSGKALGTRDYADGNEFDYFQVDQFDGNIGILEILAKKQSYVATIVSITKVETVRIKSRIIYDYIMNEPAVLRQCVTLVAQDLYRISGNDGILYYLSGIDRLRYYLINYYEEHHKDGGQVTVYAQYQDISKKVGVSVRTVGRSISQLKENGEILSSNKKIIITKQIYQSLLKHISDIFGKNE